MSISARVLVLGAVVLVLVVEVDFLDFLRGGSLSLVSVVLVVLSVFVVLVVATGAGSVTVYLPCGCLSAAQASSDSSFGSADRTFTEITYVCVVVQGEG